MNKQRIYHRSVRTGAAFLLMIFLILLIMPLFGGVSMIGLIFSPLLGLLMRLMGG